MSRPGQGLQQGQGRPQSHDQQDQGPQYHYTQGQGPQYHYTQGQGQQYQGQGRPQGQGLQQGQGQGLPQGHDPQIQVPNQQDQPPVQDTINRNEFTAYLTKMKELINKYSTWELHLNQDANVIDKIQKVIDTPNLVTAVALLKEIRERIGVLSHNLVTRSAERIKLYTNLYTVIIIYLNQTRDIASRIKLEDVAENLLSKNGILGRFGTSVIGTTFGVLSTDLMRHEKGVPRTQINLDGVKGGRKSKKRKNKRSKSRKSRSTKR